MTPSPLMIYKILSSHFSEQHWWPMDIEYHRKNGSDPRFEIIVGAILTQNTSWINVEKAINNLKRKRILDINKIHLTPIEKIKTLIKSSGFFNQKAQRLLIINTFLLEHYNGNLDHFFSQPIKDIRGELLSLNGIGPETADSILLYAGEKPVFVVDAYTKRLCHRLPLSTNCDSYDEIQTFFQKNLLKHIKKDILPRIYNEYHALIVEHAKNYCKKQKPLCKTCPIDKYCQYQEKSN